MLTYFSPFCAAEEEVVSKLLTHILEKQIVFNKIADFGKLLLLVEATLKENANSKQLRELFDRHLALLTGAITPGSVLIDEIAIFK